MITRTTIRKWLFAILTLPMPLIASAEEARLDNRPHVSIQGDAEVMVFPNHAIFRLSVQHFHRDLATVRHDNQTAVQNLLQIVHHIGLPKTDVSTLPSMVFPERWGCANCTDEEKKSGYSATTKVTVTLHDLEQVSLVAEQLTGDNHVLLEDVEYRTTELRKHRDTARAMAIRAAREKAEALAHELGQSIGPALSITEDASEAGNGLGYWAWSQWGYSCCGYYNRYSNYQSNVVTQNSVSNSGASASVADAGVIIPGRIPIRARVNVIFDLK